MNLYVLDFHVSVTYPDKGRVEGNLLRNRKTGPFSFQEARKDGGRRDPGPPLLPHR